jgi:hypothetical protein
VNKLKIESEEWLMTKLRHLSLNVKLFIDSLFIFCHSLVTTLFFG